MDQEWRPQLAQDAGGFGGARRGVGADADVAGLALVDRGGQCAHRLLEWGIEVDAVRVEDVDVVEAHALEAGLQAGQHVLARAAPTIGTRPHVPAGLGGDDQLVTIGREVLGEDPAEVLFGRTERRPVVVGQIELGDAQVEGLAHDGPLAGEGRVIAEVVPQTQRDGRQLQAAVADVAEASLRVAVRRGPIVRLEVTARDLWLLAGGGLGVVV